MIAFESYFPQYFYTLKFLAIEEKLKTLKYLIVYMVENYLGCDGNMDPN